MANNNCKNKDLEQVLHKIINKEKIRDFNIKVNDSSQKGDGYLGLVYFLEIDGKDPKGHRKRLDLVAKLAPKSKKLRDGAPIRKAFLVEIYMYKEVQAKFRKLQESHGITDPFDSIPKSYGFATEEFFEGIMMQNMRTSGYSLWNRKIPMSEEHLALGMRVYGKLHALSFALRKLEEESFLKLAAGIQYDIVGDFMENDWSVMENQCEKLLKYFDPEADKILIEEFSPFKHKIKDFFYNVAKKPDRFSVITHGDCWSNNMMFKYEDENNPKKPTSMVLLDWQCSQLSSPVLDLSYFFYCSGTKEIFADLERYLKIYHGTLSNQLRQFGCDPEELFPYTKLQEHWQKYCKYGLILALVVVKIMLSEKNETPDLTTVAESGNNIMEAFGFDSVHEEEFLNRLKDIVAHFVDRKLL